MYFLKVEAIQANLEVYWGQIDAYNDAYMHPFFLSVQSDPSWIEYGYGIVTNRRSRTGSNEFELNRKDQFARRIYVRILNEGETSTPEGRQAMLKKIQDCCMDPKNNRYNYEYVIDDRSDLTPSNKEDYVKADSYILDYVIFNIIEGIYQGVDKNWYSNNKELAQKYWEGPLYPQLACDNLGYPEPIRQEPRSTVTATEEQHVAGSENEDMDSEQSLTPGTQADKDGQCDEGTSTTEVHPVKPSPIRRSTRKHL